MFVEKSKEEINFEYRRLTSHQRCRIIQIEKSCCSAAMAIASNTPHTEEMNQSLALIRSAMATAIKLIEKEHLIDDSERLQHFKSNVEKTTVGEELISNDSASA